MSLLSRSRPPGGVPVSALRSSTGLIWRQCCDEPGGQATLVAGSQPGRAADAAAAGRAPGSAHSRPAEDRRADGSLGPSLRAAGPLLHLHLLLRKMGMIIVSPSYVVGINRVYTCKMLQQVLPGTR